jgi:hypothetical protein
LAALDAGADHLREQLSLHLAVFLDRQLLTRLAQLRLNGGDDFVEQNDLIADGRDDADGGSAGIFRLLGRRLAEGLGADLGRRQPDRNDPPNVRMDPTHRPHSSLAMAARTDTANTCQCIVRGAHPRGEFEIRRVS